MHSLLSITNLHVSVEGKEVVKGMDLHIAEGEIHAIMGPNGSGKSTLVNALMGHPKYTIMSGSASFRGTDLLTVAAEERAAAGLFLAFQYPKEISGVSLRSFLFAAHKAQATRRGEKPLSILKFKKLLEEKMRSLHMDAAFAERHVNKGFSGGEKKKSEILQMAILAPRLALLDETDSGLDIDALRIVAEGVNAMRSLVSARDDTKFSALIVTHYARILGYVKPDCVHVMVHGKIVESGGAELAQRLESKGYAQFSEAQ